MALATGCKPRIAIKVVSFVTPLDVVNICRFREYLGLSGNDMMRFADRPLRQELLAEFGVFLCLTLPALRHGAQDYAAFKDAPAFHLPISR